MKDSDCGWTMSGLVYDWIGAAAPLKCFCVLVSAPRTKQTSGPDTVAVEKNVVWINQDC